MPRTLFALLVTLTACGPSAPPVTCGPGTELVGSTCVRSDTSASDGGLEARDAGSTAVDAGVALRVGDPCPGNLEDACSARQVLTCGRLSSDPAHFRKLSAGPDCSLLDGQCTVDHGNGACTGGGYVACDPAHDANRCQSATVLALCGGRWSAFDCGAEGLVCKPPEPGNTARCGAQ